MKNACIVLQKKVHVEDVFVAKILKAFHEKGYIFEDIRILSQTNEQNARVNIVDVGKTVDNLLIIANKTALPIAKKYMADVFEENDLHTAFDGAGIYQKERRSTFLVSADATDAGVGFVQKACIPYLQKKYGVRFDKITIRTIGASEMRMDSLLADAKRYGGDRINCFRQRKFDEDVIELFYDGNAPKMLIDDVLRLFAEGLGDTMYALEDITIEQQLVNALKLRGKKLSVAESFTGGGIAKRITSVSGASEVYFEGLNTYDEIAKIKRLGVTEYTLKTLGAVSDQTAYEMAYGLLNTGDCDVAVATTGLAGPKSDRSRLPVGLCYIAVGTKERIRVYRYIFDGDRQEITEKAINYALFYTYKQVKDL